MRLVPYFCNTSDPNWITLGVFLSEGGRSCWTIEDSNTLAKIRALLKDNGFPVVNIDKKSDAVYAKIDETSIKMADFYMWTEIDPKTSENDVWRTLSIPVALWSCPVFKEQFWRSAALPFTFSIAV